MSYIWTVNALAIAKTQWTGFVQTLESPEIKMLRLPGLESLGKRHRSWKILEKSCNSKVVVLEILLPACPLAGSLSSPWYDMHIVRHSMFAVRKNILLAISISTVKVSNCAKFRIIRGSALNTAGGLQVLP